MAGKARDRGESDVAADGPSRRGFLYGGAALGLGAVAGAAAERQGLIPGFAAPPRPDAAGLNGASTVPFFGVHQAGVETPPPAFATYFAFDLKPDVDRAALARMMRVLSDDARRLMAGEPALADLEPELAARPANLAVTFGFGREFVRRANPTAVPTWLGSLPPLGIDRLEARWNDGDLLVAIGGDDAMTIAHAGRLIRRDTDRFASLRWRQAGFRRSYGTDPAGHTMRNLFGQVDGTVNPTPGTADFAKVVWASAPGWLAGGTSMVLRRIRMDLDNWDKVDRVGRENTIGRRLSDGAPITGERESDIPDLDAVDSIGFPVINSAAHVRRAHGATPEERFLRRPYTYDETPPEGQLSDVGLLFATFQADVNRQYVPVQRRLDEADLLNTWTTPVGSAVFAIPPGCAEGGFVGETLLG